MAALSLLGIAALEGSILGAVIFQYMQVGARATPLGFHFLVGVDT